MIKTAIPQEGLILDQKYSKFDFGRFFRQTYNRRDTTIALAESRMPVTKGLKNNASNGSVSTEAGNVDRHLQIDMRAACNPFPTSEVPFDQQCHGMVHIHARQTIID